MFLLKQLMNLLTKKEKASSKIEYRSETFNISIKKAVWDQEDEKFTLPSAG